MRSALLVASCLAALVAGPARAETELVVAAYPPFDESVKLAIPRFERLHPGVKVKLQTLPYGDHHNAMITALVSGTGIPDVVGLEASFVGRVGEAKVLENLEAPPYGAGARVSRLLASSLSDARHRDLAQRHGNSSTLVALPADVGPGTLFYRTDLLEKAGVTEEELIRSWESYIEAGERIRKATGASLLSHADLIARIVVRGRLRDGESLYADGKVPSRRLVLESAPRFRSAFELAKRARDAGVDARVATWSSEWMAGIRNGTIATVPAGAWLNEYLVRSLAPEAKGLWRVAQLPEGAFATWGGDYLAIPRRAAHKAEAWALIQFLCFDRAQQVAAWKATGAWPALKAAQDDAFVNAPVAFLGGQKARRLWRKAAASAPELRAGPLDPLVADVLNAELEQVLANRKDIAQALRDAMLQLDREGPDPW